MLDKFKKGQWTNTAGGFLGVSLGLIGPILFGRVMIDIGTRVFFPFIPPLAEGLGLSVVSFSWLVFLRSLVGIASPVFGLLADRYGRRRLMAAGLLVQAVGVIALVLTTGWNAAGPLVLSGLSLAAFIPAQQAYIGDQAPVNRRGRALATLELSWAATAIFILPLAGWLIEAASWRSPFLVLGLFSLVGAAITWRRLPPAEHRNQAGLSLAEARTLISRPNILAAVGVALLLFAGGTIFITLWSIWLAQDFKLTAGGLGLVATAVGLAELTGSGLSSLFIDRLGKRRGSIVGLLLVAGLLCLLPFNRTSFPAIIAGLVVLGIGFEFTIVSLVSLYAEQAPAFRGTVFSLVLLGNAVGTAIGAPLAAGLWVQSGLWAVCLTAAAGLLLAAGLAWGFLYE